MILIAGPNLTVDRTLAVDVLRPGQVLRARHAEVTPGGKGVNVARSARALGVPALLVGFAPGRTGAAVAGLLGDEGVAVRAVPCGGQVRSAAVLFEADGRVTVVNEPGPAIDDGAWAAYEQAVTAELDAAAALVCSGSLPPGAPPDAYGRLVRLAVGRGIPAVVDTAGEPLLAAATAGAALLSPNLAEAEAVVDPGRVGEAAAAPASAARERAIRAAGALAARGGAAVVTAGQAGAALAAGSARFWVAAPTVAARNPIGAGDSFVAGAAAALRRGEALPQAVVYATGVAAASVECAVAGRLDPDRVGELLAHIRLAVVHPAGGSGAR